MISKENVQLLTVIHTIEEDNRMSNDEIITAAKNIDYYKVELKITTKVKDKVVEVII